MSSKQFEYVRCARGGVGYARVARGLASLLWGCVLLFAASAARAQSPDYLKQMPAPAKVLAALKGSDRLELSAKQAGAMYQLRNLVWDLAGDRLYRNQLTPEENQLTSQYVERYGAISSATIKTFDPKETQRLGAQSTRAKWFGARTHFETSPEFRQELLERFFPPALRARVEAFDQKKQAAASGRAAPFTPASGPNIPSSQGILAFAGRMADQYMEWLIALALLGTLVFVVRYAVQSYNKLHARLEPVKKSRSGVKIAIDRRCTAVNDLVSLTQHFAQTEKLIYLKVSQDSTGAGMAAAYQQSAAVLNNVQHLAERYPNLKSNEHFHRIMDSIQSCEHEIQQHRHYSNDLVQHYNTFLQEFPRVLFARLIGFGREEYVDLDVSQARQQATAMQVSNDDARRLDHVLGVAPQQPAQLPPSYQAAPAQLGAGAAAGPAARGGGTSVVQALPQVSLRFLAGPLSGRSVPIGAGAMVGREAPAQVVVPDPQVSSAHAWIGVGNAGLIFVDRGSTNGSIVNGHPVHPGHEVQIKGGDVISLGRTNSVSFVVDQA